MEGRADERKARGRGRGGIGLEPGPRRHPAPTPGVKARKRSVPMGWRPASPVAGLRDWLVISARDDLENGRGSLWYPVFFGLGILAYFSLPREPSLIALAGLVAGLAFIAFALRRGGTAFFAALALVVLSAGMFAARLRTEMVATPILPAARLTAELSGWIVSAEPNRRGGQRLELRVAAIEGLPRRATPRRVAIGVSAAGVSLPPGAPVSLRAVLYPPSAPVLPGGHDFRRQSFYAGIGAVGFALGRPRWAAGPGPAPLSVRMVAALARLRAMIAARIGAALDRETGALAAALIVGQRRALPESVKEALRASGLAHILAISGLHMTLVAGTILVLLRGALALVPSLALDRPIRKWAALAALATAAAYLAISGAGIATQRAFIMVCVVLLAVLVDRAALTMRNVAIAALMVLAIAPESLLGPSFQMSFAAVAALVAAYEGWRFRDATRAGMAMPGRFSPMVLGGRYLAGLLLTSLIAGLATAPFAAWHFHRVAAFGLLANLLAMPVISLIVMPMGLLAMLLMPFALEIVGLAPMALGLEVVMAIARWVAGLPGAVHLLPATGVLPLALVAIAFLWLFLWRAGWRYLAIMPLALALILAPHHRRPDLLVSESGTMAAIRMPDGRLALLGRNVDRFVAAQWLRADGDDRDPGKARLDPASHCDSRGCALRLPAGPRIALALARSAFDSDCRIADIVISPLPAPPGCDEHAAVLDGPRLARRGAHAIRWDRGLGGRRMPFAPLSDDRSPPVLEVATSRSRHPRPWHGTALDR